MAIPKMCTVSGKKCKGMLAEGAEALEPEGDPVVCDLAIGGAASRVEHCEMASYQTAIALAETLGYEDAVILLTESLLEEQAAETTIKELCGRLMSGCEKTQFKMAIA